MATNLFDFLSSSRSFFYRLFDAIVHGTIYEFALLRESFIIFVIIGFTLLYYLFVIKLRFFLAYTIFTISIFIYWSIAEYSISARHLTVRLFFIVLFAFMYFFAANRYRFISLNNEFAQNKISYLKWQKNVIPIISIVLVLSILIMPGNVSQNLRNEKIFDYLESLRINIVSLFNQPKAGLIGKFNLAYVGFSHDQSKLGGSVRLSTNHVFDVNASKQIYLKGAVFENYTGTGWESKIPEEGYLLDSSTESKYRDVFCLDDVGQHRYQNIYKLYEATVRNIDINSTSIFTATNPVSVSIRDNKIFFNMRSEFYSNKPIRGNTYSFEYYDAELHSLAIDVLRNHAFDFKEPNSSNYPDFGQLERMKNIKALYLQLPESLPEPVRHLAVNITSGVYSQIDKVLLIEDYIKNNFEYTLNPPLVPDGVDFTEHFLFDTQRGYCAYYATAMTVLCRSIGIPARYVTGFRVDKPASDGFTRVHNYHAHAWTEVYFPNVGWLTFDAVSHADFLSNEIAARSSGITPSPERSRGPEKPTPTPELSSSPVPSDEITPGNTVFESASPAEGTGVFITAPPKNWYSDIDGIIVIILIGVVLTAGFIFVFINIKKRKSRELSYREKIVNIFHQNAAILSELNCPMNTGDTISKYFNKADRCLKQLEETFKFYISPDTFAKVDTAKIAVLFEKAIYSDYTLSDEEMVYIDHFNSNIKLLLNLVKSSKK